MKLYPVEGKLFVLQAHDLVFRGGRSDCKNVRKRIPPDDERVITGGFEGVGQVGEYALSLV